MDQLLGLCGNIPVLDLMGRGGATDYIDFISVTDMKYPIMQGIDRYNRPFIAFKWMTDDDGAGVGTIFQRYTDDTVLAHGTRYKSLLWHESRVRQDQYSLLCDRIKMLVETGSVNKIVVIDTQEEKEVDKRLFIYNK